MNKEILDIIINEIKNNYKNKILNFDKQYCSLTNNDYQLLLHNLKKNIYSYHYYINIFYLNLMVLI